jgi:hypothetical protein
MPWYDIFIDAVGAGNTVPRHGKRVADRDASKEDREASVAWLAENGTPEALVALCGRFGLQIENQLKDQEEKDTVVDHLVGHGAAGATAARGWAARGPHFANAVRVVERVEGAAAALGLLVELLARESVDEEFKIDKKRNLLISLAMHKSPAIVEAAARFLGDHDEGVRHAAIEALAAQEGDGPRTALLAALQRQREESTRIRGRLGEIFAARRWPVGEDPWLAQNVPHGFQLADGRLHASGR